MRDVGGRGECDLLAKGTTVCVAPMPKASGRGRPAPQSLNGGAAAHICATAPPGRPRPLADVPKKGRRNPYTFPIITRRDCDRNSRRTCTLLAITVAAISPHGPKSQPKDPSAK